MLAQVAGDREDNIERKVFVNLLGRTPAAATQSLLVFNKTQLHRISKDGAAESIKENLSASNLSLPLLDNYLQSPADCLDHHLHQTELQWYITCCHHYINYMISTTRSGRSVNCH